MRLHNIVILLTVLLAMGGIYYYLNIPKPAAPKEPRYYAWQINMDDIEHIEINVTSENRTEKKSESFVKISKADTFPWYFDDAQRSAVDTKRWGGGIPLLLSGPGVERIISKNTTPEKLAEYGIAQPRMEIKLLLGDNTTMNIAVGNQTPDGASYYVLAPNTNNDVATVDASWYGVIESLVINPPYAPPTPSK